MGVSVSKKVSKKAVCRNLIRRRVKAAYRELERRLVTGADIVVSAKEPAASARYSEIRASIAGLLKRAGVLR